MNKVFAVILGVIGFFMLAGVIIPALTWMGHFDQVTALMLIQASIKITIGVACIIGYRRLARPKKAEQAAAVE